MFDKRNVQNMYALTPMQEGMLFHALYEAGGTAYLEQTMYRIGGRLDRAVFEATWNTVMARHDVLRTLFVHQNVPQPLQILLKKREVDFHFEDLRALAPEAQSEHIQACVMADRQRTFDLARDVLMRIALFQREDAVHDMVWTTHHILMDGWSLSVLAEEIGIIFNALQHQQAPPLPPPVPFSRYIKWLKQQDRKTATAWWQQLLADYTRSVGYPGWQTVSDGPFEAQHLKFYFSEAQTEALQRLAARWHLTLNTLVQALWGLMLGQANGVTDVVFGATVSGRPPEIEGIERMVGLFINAIPVRVRYSDTESLSHLLRRLHEQALGGSGFHYCSLADIQAQSPLKQHLLNHILVFENYPEMEALGNRPTPNLPPPGDDIVVEEIGHFDHTHYNLSVLVVPGRQLGFNMACNQAVFGRDTLMAIQDHLERLVKRLLDLIQINPELPISHLMVLSRTEREALAARGPTSDVATILPARAGRPHTPPETDTQRNLLAIWQALLEKEELGIDDNFFEAGGHSLLATRIVARIHKELGVEISLPEFFDHPEVRSLSGLIEQKTPSQFESIPRQPDQEQYALSPAQRRLWILDQLEDDLVAYNLSAGYVLEGELKIEAFQQAVEQVVARHEILRTIFITVDGEPHQRILSDPPAGLLDIHDLIAAPPDDAELQRRARAEAQRPFDLATGPLLRLTLLRLTPSRQVLLMNVHHIICDGWSVPLLEKDIQQAYNAIVAGNTWHPVPLPMQYRDYAAWQTDRLNGPAGQELQRYWHTQLAGELPVLELPTDFPRQPLRTWQGHTVSRSLSPELSRALLDWCHSQDASLFMGLTALLNILLLRYTGQTEIIIGTPIAGRQHPDLDDQIGFYVNTLPLRIALTSAQSLTEILATARRVTIEAYEHQWYPFDRLVEELELARDVTRAPLFDVLLTLDNTPWQAQEMTGIQGRLLDYGTAVSQFDLTLIAVEAPDPETTGLRLDLNYNTDLLRPATAERLLGHLAELTRALLARPDEPVGDVNLLTPAEITWLRRVNATTRLRPDQTHLADAFEQQVLRTPDQLALLMDQESLTYQALNQAANRMAHHLLQEHHIEPDQPVGVLLPRSRQQIVALLGILKAGGVWLPIETALPPARQELILKNSGCRALVTTQDLLNTLPKLKSIAVVDPDRLASDMNTNPIVNRAAFHLAYIIYTSGSTGIPKGVMVEHGGFSNMITDQIRIFGIQPADRVLQFASVAFDASLSEIFMALLCGATLVLTETDMLKDPVLFTDALARHQISVITLPPSYLHALNRHPLPTLRVLITAGEPAIVDDLVFYSRSKACFNAYGPTETSVCATIHAVNPNYGYTDQVPIGYPLANTRIYILDGQRQPVPVGVSGDIVVAGAHLARGYLNQPDMTAAAFTFCPEDPEERLYWTGDRGCWREDGQIVYQGRRDAQVKIRGYRLEPAEIENRLRRHPQVQDALVLARRVGIHQQELVAWLITSDPLSDAELRQSLAQTLPAYMLPAHFVCLEAFPVSVSGKIDRKALPLPETFDTGPGDAPATDLERQLVALWQQLLGRPNLHRHSHFFDAGGDSVRAIQLASRLAQAGWSLKVKHLFQYPTIAQLAPVLTPLRASAEAETGAEASVSGEVPLTPIQHWFFEQFDTDPHHFNHAEILFSPQRLNITALQAVLAALQAHHDALRLYYLFHSTSSERPVLAQYVADATHPVNVDVTDLRGDSQPRETLRKTAQHLQRCFNLKTGPLLKTVLFQLPDGDYLLFIAHHLILDAVSWRILLDDLHLGYRQALKGEAIRLPPPTASFKAWSEALQRYSRSPELLARQSWWQAQESVPMPPLPLDRVPVRPAVMVDLETETLGLTSEKTLRLLDCTTRVPGAGIQEFLLTALAWAACRWHGRPQTLITLESHGRSLALENLDLSRTVGWFTSTFPFILRVDPEATVWEHIAQLRADLEAVPQQGMDYTIFKYLTPPELRPDLHFTLAPQLNFNYLGHYEVDSSSPWQMVPELLEETVSPAARALHDLDIVALINHGRLEMYLSYNRLAFRPATIQRLLGNMAHKLEEILTNS